VLDERFHSAPPIRITTADLDGAIKARWCVEESAGRATLNSSVTASLVERSEAQRVPAHQDLGEG
jgi:hypothetical protein